jgi:hypothetical protein
MGDWIYSSTILKLRTRWRSVLRFTPLSFYPRVNNPTVSLHARLEDVMEKSLLSLPGIELWFLCDPVSRLIGIPIDSYFNPYSRASVSYRHFCIVSLYVDVTWSLLAPRSVSWSTRRNWEGVKRSVTSDGRWQVVITASRLGRQYPSHAACSSSAQRDGKCKAFGAVSHRTQRWPQTHTPPLHCHAKEHFEHVFQTMKAFGN